MAMPLTIQPSEQAPKQIEPLLRGFGKEGEWSPTLNQHGKVAIDHKGSSIKKVVGDQKTFQNSWKCPG